MSSNTILIITDSMGVPLGDLKENLYQLEKMGYKINTKNEVPIYGIAFSFRRTETHTQVVAHSHCKKPKKRDTPYYFIYNYDRPDADILTVLKEFVFKAEEEIKNHTLEITDIKESFFLFKSLKNVITNNGILHNETKLIEAACKCFNDKKPVQLETGDIEKSVYFLVELCSIYKELNYTIHFIDDSMFEHTGTVQVYINQSKGDEISPAKQFEKLYKEWIKREEQLINNYSKGMSAFNSGDWGTAIAAFEQVMTIDTGYRDASKLLSLAASAFICGSFCTFGYRDASKLLSLAAAEKQKEIPGMFTEFVLIPAGEFDMGSPSNEKYRDSDESPVHHVKIGEAFYMGKYEVTQKQWREVMGNNPSNFKGDNLPVESVSWNDVQEFIKKLNEKEGSDKYRLPTEAEWEYAARARTTNFWDWIFKIRGENAALGDYAWYGANSGNKTHEVGMKKPNPWGLYDIHGNVWEWVQDKWHGDYNGAPTDGSSWEGGSSRVARGGSWNNYARHCRSAVRLFCDPGYRDFLSARAGIYGKPRVRLFGDPGYCDGSLGFRLLRVS